MIRLLIALHPRSWRARYAAEFQALLEASPLTAAIIVDVLCNALRQHLQHHAAIARALLGLACSSVVEVIAVHAGITNNILWLPSTLSRAVALTALFASWAPLAWAVRDAVTRRRRRRTPARG